VLKFLLASRPAVLVRSSALQKLNDKRYGLVGWKEFHNTRKEILSEFNRAKEYNVSRLVRVQHGKAGEAAVRKWLSDYLPKKYGVTSGFVIPDVIAAEYKLYHFDVLIYDRINSPELGVMVTIINRKKARHERFLPNMFALPLRLKAALTATPHETRSVN